MRAQSPLLDANYDLENNDSRNVLSGRRLKLRDFYTNYLSNSSLYFRLCTYQGLFLNCYCENPLPPAPGKCTVKWSVWKIAGWVGKFGLSSLSNKHGDLSFNCIFWNKQWWGKFKKIFFLRKYLRNDRFSITILRVWYMYIPPYFEHWVR